MALLFGRKMWHLGMWRLLQVENLIQHHHTPVHLSQQSLRLLRDTQQPYQQHRRTLHHLHHRTLLQMMRLRRLHLIRCRRRRQRWRL